MAMRFCRPLQRAFLLFSLAGSLSGGRQHSSRNLVIIANPTVKAQEISVDDLRSIFLGTKTSLGDGSYLKPVLEKSGPAHAAFLKEYLGKTDGALQTYYRGLVFSGRWSMPVSFNSDAEVVAYVEKTRGAIGYVEASAVDDGVKALRIR